MEAIHNALISLEFKTLAHARQQSIIGTSSVVAFLSMVHLPSSLALQWIFLNLGSSMDRSS